MESHGILKAWKSTNPDDGAIIDQTWKESLKNQIDKCVPILDSLFPVEFSLLN